MRTASENSTCQSRLGKHWLVPAFSALLSLMLATTVVAQKDDKDGSKRKTKETVAMSQQVYESLVEVQELVEAEDFPSALKGILAMQTGKKKMSPYETAQILNLQAYTYYLMEDYPSAIGSYEKVLQQPELPEVQERVKSPEEIETVEDLICLVVL